MHTPMTTAFKMEGLQQGAPLALHLCRDHGACVVDLLVHTLGCEIHLAVDASCTLHAVLDDEPTGALGNDHDDEEEEEGRQGLHAEHASPHLVHKDEAYPSLARLCGLRVVEQEIVDKIGSEEAHSHGELIERHHLSAIACYGYLRDVDRCHDGYDAYAHAANYAVHHQHGERCGDGASCCRDGEEHS